MCLAHSCPRHEAADAVCAVSVGEFRESECQPVVRIDAAALAVLDERRDHRPVAAALVEAGKQRVSAIQGDWSDRPFARVGVDMDTAVVEKPRDKPSPQIKGRRARAGARRWDQSR